MGCADAPGSGAKAPQTRSVCAGDRPRLTIDLDAIQQNWRAFQEIGAAEAGAAVKADAYGLGAAEVLPALARAGCRRFFVATAAEAAAARRALTVGGTQAAGAGTEAPEIYVLNGAAEGLEAIAAAAAWPILNTLAEAEALIHRVGDRPLPAALQIETGMNRLGLTAEECAALLAHPGRARLDIRIILSHLACADAPDDPLNAEQRARFATALPALKAAWPGAKASLSATGGALLGEDFAFDLVRPGVGLYGGAPFAAARPVVTLDAPLIRVWEPKPGEKSGYGGAFTTPNRPDGRPTRLAAIPVGYADGVPRALSNCGEARLHGQSAPFAGRVSMDLVVLDVSACDGTAAPAAQPGDRAVLLDEDLTIDAMAALAGTIGYEILTRLGARYVRRYVGGAGV